MPKRLFSQINNFNPSFVLTFAYVLGIMTLFSGDILINRLHEQQFVYLAQSFVQGKLYFLNIISQGYDTTLFNNKNYWPEGPFPAILLMPFVFIFGALPLQGYLAFGLNILNWILLFKIAQKITNNKITSFWLSFSYIFATAYFNVSLKPNYAYFAQIVATAALLLSIYEYLHRKRWFLIGIFLGVGTLTRSNLILCCLFFISQIAVIHTKTKFKIINFLHLLSPIIISLLLILIYNFLRFQNPFEQGYTHASAGPFLTPNWNYGIWNIIHFPANFYYLFLKGPEAVFIPNTHVLQPPYIYANPWGLSIFFTSPIFLWIFKNRFNTLIQKGAALTVLVILLSLLGYAGIGFSQVGYRYGLDFYPFLYLLLCYSVTNGVSLKLKVTIILSFIFNYYLALVSGF